MTAFGLKRFLSLLDKQGVVGAEAVYDLVCCRKIFVAIMCLFSSLLLPESDSDEKDSVSARKKRPERRICARSASKKTSEPAFKTRYLRPCAA